MNTLRTGWTTGACAAAAAKAAVWLLCRSQAVDSVEIVLPGGQIARLAIAFVRATADGAVAGVRKDAGDDPDITNGATVVVSVCRRSEGDVAFLAGEGVGIVTKPGLQIPPGEPAVNPAPRRMIRDVIRAVTSHPVAVTISIPGGRALAEQTFNPRLGITGGLSILGTTGIVRPRCVKALRAALKCALDVAAACQVNSPVLVPGNIGARAARARFALGPEQLVEVANEWSWILDQMRSHNFSALMAVGHPGKLAKLADGEWDTHSRHSRSAVLFVRALAEARGQPTAAPPDTVEGLFMALPPPERRALGNTLAARVRDAIETRLARRLPAAVLLVNMKGEELGSAGDFEPWS